MIVVNLFGGPGSGKSTLAAGVFSQMKLSGRHGVELVTEYAKDLVWEGIPYADFDQLDIFANQYRRVARLSGQREYAITDSPLLLTPIYLEQNMEENLPLRSLAIQAHQEWHSINFLVERDRTRQFSLFGRHHDEAASDKIGEACAALLTQLGCPYILVPGNQIGIDKMVGILDGTT